MIRRTAMGAVATALLLRTAFAATDGKFVTYEKSMFDRAQRDGRTILVHVHADWCPTCRAQQPTLTKLVTDSRMKDVVAITVDFDKDTDFRKTFNVSKQSTVLMFKGSKETLRSIAVTDPSVLETSVLSALSV